MTQRFRESLAKRRREGRRCSSRGRTIPLLGDEGGGEKKLAECRHARQQKIRPGGKTHGVLFTVEGLSQRDIGKSQLDKKKLTKTWTSSTLRNAARHGRRNTRERRRTTWDWTEKIAQNRELWKRISGSAGRRESLGLNLFHSEGFQKCDSRTSFARR